MAGNFSEFNQFPSVPKLSDLEDVDESILNPPHQALVDRTRWLKSELEATRTLSDITPPTGDTGTIIALIGFLGNMIKAITGKTSWRTAPATTLEVAKTHIDASAPHSGHAAAAHGHTNGENIGGPYSLGNHGHTNSSNIGGPYASETHGHANGENIGGPFAAQSHNHDAGNLTAGIVPTARFASGMVVGSALATQGSVVSCPAGGIPLDDTVPQSGEGTLILSRSYTPRLANSTIRVTAELHVLLQSNVTGVAALFQNINSNAITAAPVNEFHVDTSGVGFATITITGIHFIGVITPVTYSVRGSGFTVNALPGGGRVFGGACLSSLKIEEISQ